MKNFSYKAFRIIYVELKSLTLNMGYIYFLPKSMEKAERRKSNLTGENPGKFLSEVIKVNAINKSC